MSKIESSCSLFRCRHFLFFVHLWASYLLQGCRKTVCHSAAAILMMTLQVSFFFLWCILLYRGSRGSSPKNARCQLAQCLISVEMFAMIGWIGQLESTAWALELTAIILDKLASLTQVPSAKEAIAANRKTGGSDLTSRTSVLPWFKNLRALS